MKHPVIAVYVNGAEVQTHLVESQDEFTGWLWGYDVNLIWYFVNGGAPFQVTQFGGDIERVINFLNEKAKVPLEQP